MSNLITTINEQPRARPLHVEPKRRARIFLEGPALSIEMTDASPVYVPLRRISRIHLSPRVDIETCAILACAERGIVLMIHDNQEETIARIIGAASDHTRLRQRLIDLTDMPDWESRYHDWKHAMERRLCVTLGKRIHAPQVLWIHPERLRKWIDKQITESAGSQNAVHTASLFRQISIAWMQDDLLQRGVGAENEFWVVGSPDLAEDLAGLLAFRLESIRFGWLTGRARAAKRLGHRSILLKRKAIITKIEQQHPRIQRFGSTIVNWLHRWLVEIT